MRELAADLWHWQAPHPDWEGRLAAGRPNEPWDQVVSSYAMAADDGRLLLVDPLALPSEIEELAAGRETAVLLTAPWHERDTRLLVKRHEWPLFAPPRETEDDFVAK